eukprot:scpid84546/ scgid4512/ 
MCFSSCSTIGRKELRLQLKVESAGCELCQTSVTMRVCACPGRDRINLESRDTAEKEEQGGSAYAESPFPTLSLPVPVKREHSDSEGDEEVTHQVILKGPRRAVDACIENLVLDAKQYSIQLGGSRLVWYTEQREPAGAESSQVSSSSGDSEPPKVSHVWPFVHDCICFYCYLEYLYTAHYDGRFAPALTYQPHARLDRHIGLGAGANAAAVLLHLHLYLRHATFCLVLAFSACTRVSFLELQCLFFFFFVCVCA